MSTTTFPSLPKYPALLACLGIISGICLVECKTPDQLSIATLYFFPVGWATWVGGIRWGTAAVFVATTAWGIANYAVSPVYDQIGYRAWTIANDLVVYGFLVVLVDRSHQVLDEQKAATEALQHALDEVRTLECLLPVCAWCKRVRDDKGYWGQIEEYLARDRGTLLSHGICPECAEAARREAEAEKAIRKA